jgi:hypothetical protein
MVTRWRVQCIVPAQDDDSLVCAGQKCRRGSGLENGMRPRIAQREAMHKFGSAVRATPKREANRGLIVVMLLEWSSAMKILQNVSTR